MALFLTKNTRWKVFVFVPVISDRWCQLQLVSVMGGVSDGWCQLQPVILSVKLSLDPHRRSRKKKVSHVDLDSDDN